MGDDTDRIKQDEIENLLKQAQQSTAGDSGGDALDQGDIESLMQGGASESPPPAPEIGDSDKALGQADIESLLSSAGASPRPAPKPPAATRADAGEDKGDIAQGDIELLLNQAEQAIESVQSGLDVEIPDDLSLYRFEDFAGAAPSADAATLDLLRDVELDLRIELGRTNLHLEDVLRLRRGSVVPLDKLAGDPVDVYVNGRLIARGEVLVLNDNFCVRVAELIVGEAVVQ